MAQSPLRIELDAPGYQIPAHGYDCVRVSTDERRQTYTRGMISHVALGNADTLVEFLNDDGTQPMQPLLLTERQPLPEPQIVAPQIVAPEVVQPPFVLPQVQVVTPPPSVGNPLPTISL